MFRRGKQPSTSAADARQALFEKLAQRPENVCPFLGLAGDRSEFQAEVTDEHRCHAFGDPEPLSDDQQRTVCLQRGYANCPRYLRGVLVIPTDELEALRRPPQRVPPPPPPRRPAAPRPAAGGGRRRLAAVLVSLLLLGGAGAGGWWYLAGPGSVAGGPTQSPTPSVASLSPTPVESFVATPSPAPTPEPGDEFIGYEVTVSAGTLDIFKVDDAGAITDESHAFFSGFSQAPVDRVVAANGRLHWRVTGGELIGWSYIRDDSGPFLIREVYRGSDGSLRYTALPEDET